MYTLVWVELQKAYRSQNKQGKHFFLVTYVHIQSFAFCKLATDNECNENIKSQD